MTDASILIASGLGIALVIILALAIIIKPWRK